MGRRRPPGPRPRRVGTGVRSATWIDSFRRKKVRMRQFDWCPCWARLRGRTGRPPRRFIVSPGPVPGGFHSVLTNAEAVNGIEQHQFLLPSSRCRPLQGDIFSVFRPRPFDRFAPPPQFTSGLFPRSLQHRRIHQTGAMSNRVEAFSPARGKKSCVGACPDGRDFLSCRRPDRGVPRLAGREAPREARPVRAARIAHKDARWIRRPTARVTHVSYARRRRRRPSAAAAPRPSRASVAGSGMMAIWFAPP